MSNDKKEEPKVDDGNKEDEMPELENQEGADGH